MASRQESAVLPTAQAYSAGAQASRIAVRRLVPEVGLRRSQGGAAGRRGRNAARLTLDARGSSGYSGVS
jgi:hypothetical protein